MNIAVDCKYKNSKPDPRDQKILKIPNRIRIMVLILDGNSLTDVHVKHNICNWTCLRHLITHKSVIFIRKDLFSFMREQHAMSYHKYYDLVTDPDSG